MHLAKTDSIFIHMEGQRQEALPSERVTVNDGAIQGEPMWYPACTI
jgi:hypothetical protein